MKLYLKNSRTTKEIYPVTLAGGYIPTLGSQQLFTPDEVDTKAMESALWHKVLVIDWMTIDCDRKVVHWSSIKASKIAKPNSPKSQSDNNVGSDSPKDAPVESVYIIGECEFDDLDQVYMNIGAMLDKLHRNQITDSDLNHALFSLLHTNILPAVKLTKSDIPSVELAILAVKDCMVQKSNEIVQFTGQVDNIEKALRKLRRQFVEDLLQLKPELVTSMFSQQLLQYLYEGVLADFEKSADKLNKLQYSVEEVKLTSSGSSSDELNEQLENLRQERDKFYNNDHLRLIEGREFLRGLIHGSDAALFTASQKSDTLSSSKLKKAANARVKENVNDKQMLYLGTADHLKTLAQSAKRLTIQQLLIVSVREALLSSLSALQSGAEMSVSDVDLMGRQPTDVLRSSRIPTEWLTVDAFVARTLEKDVSLRAMHASFCNTVSSYCQEVINVHKLKQQGASQKLHGGSDGGINTLPAARQSMPATLAKEREPLSKSLPEQRKSLGSSNKSSVVNGKESRSHVSDKHHAGVVLEVLTGNNSINFSDLSVTDNDHDAVIILSSKSDIMRPALDQLKVMIHAHIQKMADIIKLSWYETSEFAFRKIWLSYERHLYEATIDDVVRMYNECYESVMEKFVSWLPRLTLADLDIRDEGTRALLSGRQSNTSFGVDLVAESSSEVEANVDVIVPTSSARVFSRTTWPLEHGVSHFRQSIGDGLELHDLARHSMDWALADSPFFSDEEEGGDLDDEVLEVHSSSLSPRNESAFFGGDRFAVALAYLTDMLTVRSVLLKVRLLECCIREVNQQVREYYRENSKKPVGINADDLMDLLSYLICSCDVSIAANVYPQLMMLVDLMPEFMERGSGSFCLTNFVAAFTSLQDRIVLKQKLLKPVSESLAFNANAQRQAMYIE